MTIYRLPVRPRPPRQDGVFLSGSACVRLDCIVADCLRHAAAHASVRHRAIKYRVHALQANDTQYTTLRTFTRLRVPVHVPYARSRDHAHRPYMVVARWRPPRSVMPTRDDNNNTTSYRNMRARARASHATAYCARVSAARRIVVSKNRSTAHAFIRSQTRRARGRPPP